jgi:hypothetical protein
VRTADAKRAQFVRVSLVFVERYEKLGAQCSAGGGGYVTILKQLENVLEGVKVWLGRGSFTGASGMKSIGLEDVNGVSIWAIGGAFTQFAEGDGEVCFVNGGGGCGSTGSGVVSLSWNVEVDSGWIEAGDGGKEFIGDGGDG